MQSSREFFETILGFRNILKPSAASPWFGSFGILKITDIFDLFIQEQTQIKLMVQFPHFLETSINLLRFDLQVNQHWDLVV